MNDFEKLRIRAAYTYLSEAIDAVGEYPEKIVFSADYLAPVSLANPLSFMLAEGLIKTYPTEKSVEYVKDLFNLPEDAIKIVRYKDIEKLLITFVPRPENWDVLMNAMNLCGFFLSRPKPEEIYDYLGKEVRLQFEKKFDDDLTDKLRKSGENLIHLTPVKNVDKIKEIGIIPSTKNLSFNYPERVYLLKSSTPDDVINWLCAVLSGVFKNDRKRKKINYAKMLIDINKLQEGTVLRHDPNLPIYGMYTTSNIPPSAIIGSQELEIYV